MIRKIAIRGEVFSFEDRYPLAEAIALEEALGMSFGAWDAGMKSGSAKSLAAYVWLVLKRNGRDVPLADILSGKYPLDVEDVTDGEDAAGPDPTEPPPSSPGTGDDTSESSPISSDTGPGTLTSSPSESSTS